MRVDVSEIKTFRACRRQWQLSSRNKFHLRPLATPPALAMGTLFHESLAQLYLEVSLDKVMTMVKREMSPESDGALLAMIPGYAKSVLPHDLDRYKVLDIEHHFAIVPTTSDGELLFDPVMHEKRDEDGNKTGEFEAEHPITICGSIDLVALDIEENAIYGFEHKTCKSFRDESFLWMDEQPRVYTWALQKYVKEYNERQHNKWVEAMAQWELHTELPKPEEPVPAKLGGIYLNEVKKLLRQFQYQRTLCVYEDEDMDNFMEAFFGSCNACKHAVDTNSFAAPSPSYFNCNMCSFKSICTTYLYKNLDEKEIREEFAEEFARRSEDHLDEKQERSAE